MTGNEIIHNYFLVPTATQKLPSNAKKNSQEKSQIDLLIQVDYFNLHSLELQPISTKYCCDIKVKQSYLYALF